MPRHALLGVRKKYLSFMIYSEWLQIDFFSHVTFHLSDLGLGFEVCKLVLKLKAAKEVV